ncbi:MAG: HU family DNA-binding protein, partial [Thermodesulfobacteriota bacterium]|nr:HU family DNA-binding protein [Thermodesulfobacteriota bacterium]
RNARLGRNPKTGQSVKISAKQVPCFRAGKDLKERVDHSK